jgi:hypothetical protein
VVSGRLLRRGKLPHRPDQADRVDATALILVHNHPSSDPTPSPEGVQFTRTLVEAGKMMDIEVLDHLVIGRGKYVSLKERRPGFSECGSPARARESRPLPAHSCRRGHAKHPLPLSSMYLNAVRSLGQWPATPGHDEYGDYCEEFRPCHQQDYSDLEVTQG